MKVSRKFRLVGEVFLLWLGLAAFPLLPRKWLLGLSRWLGLTAFRLARRTRQIALANLKIAFGDGLSPAERRSVAIESFQMFSRVLLDLFWFSRWTRRRVSAYVRFDPSFDHYFDSRPVVAVTGHFGNWEIMGQAAALRGDPSVSVATAIENRVADRALTRMRKRTGQRIVERRGAVRSLMTALKAGGKTALVMDQNTLPEEGGVYVDFFGLPVPASRMAAALSAKTGAWLVPTFCVPDRDGGYRAYARLPFKASDRDSELDITQKAMRMMEEEIRAHPGQWLWMYKRWKYIPEDHLGERYPFYARPARTGRADTGRLKGDPT